jgi:hypothetical protein
MRLQELAANWRPPSELERSRPRELRLRPAGIVLIVFAAVLASGSIASGVLLYLKASADHEARRQVVDGGRDTAGQVVRRLSTRSGDKRRYWIHYEYRAGGQVYLGRIEVGRRGWQELDTDARVPVRYLPSDPARHIVMGRAGRLMPLWVPYLVAGGLALGAWAVTRPLASQRRLLAQGRPAPAIVTRHEKTKHGVVVHFVFQLLSGSTAEGKTGPQRKPPSLESILCILYLPDCKHRHGVYPLSLVRTAREEPRGPSRNPALELQ